MGSWDIKDNHLWEDLDDKRNDMGSKDTESNNKSESERESKFKNFLGDSSSDDRTMHYALILPTKELLIINGGNYDFYGPVRTPLLLSPEFDGTKLIGYDQKRMSDAVEPRLYHNSALLLPDGRVMVLGGNTARATIDLSQIAKLKM